MGEEREGGREWEEGSMKRQEEEGGEYERVYKGVGGRMDEETRSGGTYDREGDRG